MSDLVLNFKIVTPQKIVYENNIIQATIPTVEGEITILKNHIPLVSVISSGELAITDQQGKHLIAIAGGFLEVKENNQIILLADNAERAEEIDVERAEAARQRAIEQMEKAKSVENIDYARLQAVIDREMNRIKIGKKYKNIPRARQQQE